jgi:cytochrome c553
MSPMAKSLTDEDIEDLAAFYNSLPVRDAYQ